LLEVPTSVKPESQTHKTTTNSEGTDGWRHKWSDWPGFPGG
jgi:hypothetical protein